MGFAFAQHPNDPGYPDAVWIERINMNQVIAVGGFGRDFAVECSINTDQGLAGFSVPLTFYHAIGKKISRVFYIGAY